MKSSTNPGAATQRRFDLWACIALAAVAIILYLPALGGDFVYDSRLTVLGNDYAHDLRHLWDIFTLRVMHLDVMDNNRPVYLATTMFNWALWGAHPMGHHLSNILLHAVVAVLLFKACRKLLPEAPAWAPLVAVLLFVVHPVNSESVAEISYRNDLMVAACLLGALNLAMIFQPVWSRRNLLLGAACVLCMFLAVGSKENGVAGPPLLIAYWLLFRRNEPRAGWIALCAAASVVVAGFLVARFTLRPEVSVIFVQEPARPGGTLENAMSIQPRIWMFYFKQIAWPAHLGVDYGPFTVRNYDPTMSLLAVLCVLGVQVYLAVYNRVFALGMALFWFALLPVSNIVPIYRPMADRFLYVPMAGMAIMVASLPWWRGAMRKPALALAMLAACALIHATYLREKVWHDSLSLWTDSFLKNPPSVDSRNALAGSLYSAGKYEESVIVFQQTIVMAKGKIADHYASMALALDALGRKQEADVAFKKAFALDPRYAQTELLLQALIWEKEDAAKLQVIADRQK